MRPKLRVWLMCAVALVGVVLIFAVIHSGRNCKLRIHSVEIDEDHGKARVLYALDFPDGSDAIWRSKEGAAERASALESVRGPWWEPIRVSMGLLVLPLKGQDEAQHLSREQLSNRLQVRAGNTYEFSPDAPFTFCEFVSSTGVTYSQKIEAMKR
jgi:hypothetical protein